MSTEVSEMLGFSKSCAMKLSLTMHREIVSKFIIASKLINQIIINLI